MPFEALYFKVKSKFEGNIVFKIWKMIKAISIGETQSKTKNNSIELQATFRIEIIKGIKANAKVVFRSVQVAPGVFG